MGSCSNVSGRTVYVKTLESLTEVSKQYSLIKLSQTDRNLQMFRGNLVPQFLSKLQSLSEE
jgi:hypothetical protein